MSPDNAELLLAIDEIKERLFRFKSRLSLTILLITAREGGTCDLRVILKRAATSPITTRQHVQMLIDDGFLAIGVNEAHRRAKRVDLTERGAELLRRFESELSVLVPRWTPDGEGGVSASEREAGPEPSATSAGDRP